MQYHIPFHFQDFAAALARVVRIFSTLTQSRSYCHLPLLITNIFFDFSKTILNNLKPSFRIKENLQNTFFEGLSAKCARRAKFRFGSAIAYNRNAIIE
jgi:hypothetical protein